MLILNHRMTDNHNNNAFLKKLERILKLSAAFNVVVLPGGEGATERIVLTVCVHLPVKVFQLAM